MDCNFNIFHILKQQQQQQQKPKYTTQFHSNSYIPMCGVGHYYEQKMETFALIKIRF